jgi:hypothetical protein
MKNAFADIKKVVRNVKLLGEMSRKVASGDLKKPI